MNGRLLEGKVVLVTGSSRGIGAAVSAKCAAHGASVAINYRTDEENARRVCESLRERTQAICVKADVSDEAEAESLIEGVEATFGRLDILVNNAGINLSSLLIPCPEKVFQDTMDVNIKGAFNCTKYAAKIMMSQKYGRIIHVSSVAALHPSRGQSVYAASKGALNSFTLACACELGKKGITVNAVLPGAIQTDMLDEALHVAEKDIVGRTCLRRLGTPGEVAELVVFLASDLASFITGQLICVDGGYANG